MIGLLVTQVGFMKNLHAQNVDTPAQKAVGEQQLPVPVQAKPVTEKPVETQKPTAASQRKKIPFASQCSFFKGQTKVNRQQALKQKADFILVSKSLRRLVLFANDVPLKAYNINLGFTPVGHKVQEGDGKTPEGQYEIEFKNWNSQFHRSLRVSYPNARDKARARALEVSPGGNIMIHGEHYDEDKRAAIREWIAVHGKSDWTHGCLAVRNGEIDEIYQYVGLKTFIEICP